MRILLCVVALLIVCACGRDAGKEVEAPAAPDLPVVCGLEPCPGGCAPDPQDDCSCRNCPLDEAAQDAEAQSFSLQQPAHCAPTATTICTLICTDGELVTEDERGCPTCRCEVWPPAP